MFEHNKLNQQKDGKKSDSRNTTCLGVNPIKSVDRIDTQDRPSDKSNSYKSLRNDIDMSTNDKFLRSYIANPNRQQCARNMSD
jgi:hypothetical protein